MVNSTPSFRSYIGLSRSSCFRSEFAIWPKRAELTTLTLAAHFITFYRANGLRLHWKIVRRGTLTLPLNVMITQHVAISMTLPILNDTVPGHLMGYMMSEVTGLPT